MPSILNGLSQMGSGIASFAGTAGLELQKGEIAKQAAILADQLATTREKTVTQPFQASQQAAELASRQAIATTGAQATLGAAGISAAASKYAADVQSKDVYAQIAAAAPERAAVILNQNQQTALATVNAENAKALQDAHTALQAAESEATPDQSKIMAARDRVTSLETSASTEAANTTAAAAMYRTDVENVQQLNTRLQAAVAALNSPDMSDTDKVQQKALITQLQTQLTGAQRAAEYSGNLVHGRVGAATHNPPPGTGSGPIDLNKFLTTPGDSVLNHGQ